MYSVVGTAEGVGGGWVTITRSVAGTGVGIAVAGVFVPELVVQPEESTHSRITSANIRILTGFMSSSLILIHISDLRFFLFSHYQLRLCGEAQHISDRFLSTI